jgi:hypothetical protein
MGSDCDTLPLALKSGAEREALCVGVAALPDSLLTDHAKFLNRLNLFQVHCVGKLYVPQRQAMGWLLMLPYFILDYENANRAHKGRERHLTRKSHEIYLVKRRQASG